MAEGREEENVAEVVAELPLQGLIEDTNADYRRSTRKTSLRARRAKSSPKSPLMRMAEMRKEGLRGRALRFSGKKGLGGFESLVGKGKKGFEGRGSAVLAVIPECSEVGVDFQGVGKGGMEGLQGMDGAMVLSVAGDLGVGAGSGEGALLQAGGELIGDGGVGVSGGLDPMMVADRPGLGVGFQRVLGFELEGASEGVVPLSGMQSDLALDLISAQPLQEMEFGGAHVSTSGVVDGGKDCAMLEQSLVVGNGGLLAEEFPLLSKENLKADSNKDRSRGGGGERVAKGDRGFQLRRI